VIALSASFFLWLVPINVKAPKFVVFLSFVASGCGYLYAFTLATPMSDQNWYNASKRQQEREIMTHDLALEQLAAEEALKLHYFGEAQFEEKEAIAAGHPNTIDPGHEAKSLPSAVPDHLLQIAKLAQENGGTIKIRDVQRAPGLANKFKADDIKAYFLELQSRGFGNVVSDGRSYTFKLSRQVSLHCHDKPYDTQNPCHDNVTGVFYCLS
jgi:hypothetical protein